MYQDRLVKELQLNVIATQEATNEFLVKENGFCDKLNAKFTIEV